MEFTKLEVAELEKVEAQTAEQVVRELGEMQLVLVGGGIGNVALG